MVSSMTNAVAELPSVVLTAANRQEFLGRMVEFQFMLSELTLQQANFVLAYLRDPTNMTAAARAAGSPEKSARVAAQRHLGNPKIAAAIALGEQLREDRTMITTDRTLHEFAIIAFSDITMFEFRDGSIATKPGVPEYMTRAIASMDLEEREWRSPDGVPRFERRVKIKLHPKNEALRLIALHQKILAGPTVNVQVNDNSVHTHQHQHNTWEIGGKRLTF